LPECIESALNSKYDDFEYIIVDDCSKDDSFEIVRHYERIDERIRAFRNSQNLGDYRNRNRAASLANGEYLKFLDSDNVMYPFGLASMVEAMERFPSAGLGLLSKSDVYRPFPVVVSPREAYRENFLCKAGYFGRAPDSAIIRRVCFESVGGFSGKRFIGDYELWLKMAQTFDVVKIAPYFGWDRTHIGQEKNTSAKFQQKLRKELTLEFLDSPDCPLAASDVKKAKEVLRRQDYLDLLQNLKQWIKRYI